MKKQKDSGNSNNNSTKRKHPSSSSSSPRKKKPSFSSSSSSLTSLSISTLYSKATTTTLHQNSPHHEHQYHQLKKLNYKFLQSIESQGLLESTLWPHFTSLSSSSSSCQKNNELDKKAALLIVFILNIRHALNSGSCMLQEENNSGLFSFIHSNNNNNKKEEEPFSYFFQTIVQILSQPEQFLLKTQVIQFCIIAYSLLLTNTNTNNTNTSFSFIKKKLLHPIGVPLVSFIPLRRRNLELKKWGLLRKKWGYYQSQKEKEKEESSSSFVRSWIEDLLEVLGCGDLYTLEMVEVQEEEEVEEVDSENEEEDENEIELIEEEEEDEKEHKKKKQPIIQHHQKQSYLHKSLEFLQDLLSSPLTRPYLSLYLASIHFTTCVALSPLYTHTTTTLTSSSSSNSFNPLLQSLLSSLITLENPMIQKDETESEEEEGNVYIQRAHILQKLCYRHYATYNPLHDLIYAGVTRITSSSSSSSSTGKQQHSFLKETLNMCDTKILEEISIKLRLIETTTTSVSKTPYNYFLKKDEQTKRTFLQKILFNHHTSPPSPTTLLSTQPLYPTESILWNPHLVPPSLSSSDLQTKTLSLPKLNTSFLSISHYLTKCYTLLQLESAYGIRGDIVDVVRRMRPTLVQNSYTTSSSYLEEEEEQQPPIKTTKFAGWARMALELPQPLEILKVSPCKLGEFIPSEVVADFCLDFKNCGETLRKEWMEVDGLKEFDNLFLGCVDAAKMSGGLAPLARTTTSTNPNTTPQQKERRIPDEEDPTFPHRYGITAIRGCMVLQVRDEEGTILSDPSYQLEQQQQQQQEKGAEKKPPKGTKRFLRVMLDPAQYAADANGQGSPLGTDVYKTLNIVVRRRGRENNFKAMLETIRGLMKGGTSSIYRSVPKWFKDVLLGIGDPASANYKSKSMRAFAKRTVGVTDMEGVLDYGDTFLDGEHLGESFGACCEILVDGVDLKKKIKQEKEEGGGGKRKKYRVRVIDPPSTTGKGSVEKDMSVGAKVEATSYPFPSGFNGNPIRFTPVQVNAIRSGLSPGLTLIVGPPGTGKTDVAVQIIANLYHSFPTQRTVLVTHSNAALNDLFEKVMARGDIDERYMLRLGAGERDLQTTSAHDFTKTGRVAHILSRRGQLLEIVQCLSESLGVSGAAERGADGSPSYTCETASYFNLHHIQKRVHVFEEKVRAKFLGSAVSEQEQQNVGKFFPFKKYFGLDSNVTMTIEDAKAKFNQLQEVFSELAEYRPLELLRSQRQRTDYLLTKQARIVAMTCTHAAIARSHLVELGFQYDNIVMEEAGQMLDVETCIPLLLQKGESDGGSSVSSSSSRLKRVCLIGDHHQLPPVVKNMSFSKFSHLDQSLFTRLIRLGVPSIELDRQGRARPEIAKLYSWRYRNLGDLEHVNTRPAFQKANTGFAYTYQVINVEDFEGRGESTPTAYFYQNLGEAEYAVALFQYMVLVGYPPEKISILTTYNGQKELLLDILSQRCGPGTPLAGKMPGAVSTVDQYQGQQNDFVLLSLVRTRSVGHLRDIRRLVVAVSRARLGLYVFCRQNVFGECHELRRTMDQFAARPSKLHLVPGEHFPTNRSLKDGTDSSEEGKKFVVEDVGSLGSIVHSMQEELCVSNAT